MKRFYLLMCICFLVLKISTPVVAEEFQKAKKQKLIKIEAIQIYDPSTASDSDWQSSSKVINWEDIIQVGNINKFSLKVKIKFAQAVNVEKIEDLALPIKLSVFTDPTLKNGEEIKINDDDKLSPDKKELWLTVKGNEIPNIGLLYEGDDGLNEFCSFEAESSTNFNDSDAFDMIAIRKMGLSGYRVSARGGGNSSDSSLSSGDKGTIRPFAAKADINYFKSAGAVLLQVEVKKKIETRLIKSQADWFYVSAHGSFNGYIILKKDEVYIYPKEIGNFWKDIERVYFSLCSILYIPVDESDPSYDTGRKWAKTGSKYYFGYRDYAPGDIYDPGILQGHDFFYTAKIVEKAFEYESNGNSAPRSWLLANSYDDRNEKVYNSCAIKIDGSNITYWYWGINPETKKHEIKKKTISL